LKLESRSERLVIWHADTSLFATLGFVKLKLPQNCSNNCALQLKGL